MSRTARARARVIVGGIGLVALASCLVAGCADEEIVLATLPLAADGGGPVDVARCVDDSECSAGSFCARRACGDVAGMCEALPIVCDEDALPVCGCDGVTYWNDCLRRAAEITAMKPGPCIESTVRRCGPRPALPDADAGAGAEGEECPPGTFCARLLPPGPDGTLTCPPDVRGTCWALPAACPVQHAGPDRWRSCAPSQSACITTCDAIRTATGGPRRARDPRSSPRERRCYRRAVDVVALISLATSVEVEAPLLAADLGAAVYETALLLRAPCPVPLLRTPDRARALALLAAMRARGHDVVACEASSVVSADAMVQVRAFQLEDDALSLTSTSGASERLAWSDVVAFVRAMHRTRVDRVEKTTSRKFSIGRAAMSGGVLLTAKETKETTRTSEEREQVLYVFRRGGVPLLFGQSRLRYDGLGVTLRPSQLENFNVLVGLLRARAPNAPSDERLLSPRPGLDRVRAGVAGATSSSSSDGVDLLAHLIALAGARVDRPYR